MNKQEPNDVELLRKIARWTEYQNESCFLRTTGSATISQIVHAYELVTKVADVDLITDALDLLHEEDYPNYLKLTKALNLEPMEPTQRSHQR
jgi:hypothetical protein